jgi:DNA-directed RNA polymerase sigma subunit (sigma70/sigma32)
VLGLTRERVRQIESETLAGLAADIEGTPRATISMRPARQLRRGA